MRKSIGAFTSIRSDFGHQLSLLNRIKSDNELELKLLVGGAHLIESLGFTVNSIKESGIEISATFDYLSWKDEKTNISNDMSILLKKFSDYTEKNNLDLMILYGDRYELLPLAYVCLLKNIPIAHLSGGEITEGVIDNQIRHSITKMANLHYPTLDAYKQNIIQMGEEAWRIEQVGEPGLEQLSTFLPLMADEFYQSLSLPVGAKFLLCTFHPETIKNEITVSFLDNLIFELHKYYPGELIFTGANSDEYGNVINQFLKQKAMTTPSVHFYESLGQLRYYSAMTYAEAMLGNSSSGIIEAQSFFLPALNVGKRQEGRLKNLNVVDCEANSAHIKSNLLKVLDPAFKKNLFRFSNIFTKEKSSEKIVTHFKKNLSNKNLLLKKSIF